MKYIKAIISWLINVWGIMVKYSIPATILSIIAIIIALNKSDNHDLIFTFTNSYNDDYELLHNAIPTNDKIRLLSQRVLFANCDNEIRIRYVDEKSFSMTLKNINREINPFIDSVFKVTKCKTISFPIIIKASYYYNTKEYSDQSLYIFTINNNNDDPVNNYKIIKYKYIRKLSNNLENNIKVIENTCCQL
jgi:hypothetical protein